MFVNGKGMFCRHRQWRTVRIRRNAFATGAVLQGRRGRRPLRWELSRRARCLTAQGFGRRPGKGRRGRRPLRRVRCEFAGDRRTFRIRLHGRGKPLPYVKCRADCPGMAMDSKKPQGSSRTPSPAKRKMKPPGLQAASIQLCCFTARDRGR